MKIRKRLHKLTGYIVVLSILYLYGTYGAAETGKIGLMQYIIQSIVGITILAIGAIISNLKIMEV